MSTPNNNNPDRSMLWMGAAMVACCAVPIVFALSLGGGLGAFFGSANRSSNQTGKPASDRSTQTNPIGVAKPTVMMSQVDRQFIAMMIPHHEQAIQMADLALTRAKRPEVKQLAQTIEQDQTREIQQMRTWYKSWYGAEVVAMPMYSQQMPQSGGMQGMRMDLMALKNAADFDQEFLRQMIFHHQMAIQMGQMDASRFTRPELRELSQSIVKTQTTEIDQMQKWNQTWYKSNP
jgi:uncharacterized protein (DUF305 family)